MIYEKILLILGCVLHSHSVMSIWTCSQDADCTDSIISSICHSGECICPVGKQLVLSGTACVDLAPYHTSACTEDFQCSRLFTSFQCRRSDNSTELQDGACHCQPGHHYFLGRCWPSSDFGEECTRDEECMGVVRDPYSMSCNRTCECADGYYKRQRGECRRSGLAVGDGCVLDNDCRFANGACDISTFTCVDSTSAIGSPLLLRVRRGSSIPCGALRLPTRLHRPEIIENNPPFLEAFLSEVVTNKSSELIRSLPRQHGVGCDVNNPCESPFECSRYGICVCPLGYYPNVAETMCLAELGSPVSREEQCVNLFTEIRDGICTCQANFFFDEAMRSCVKASIRITDSCLTDENCHTFGASARCGEPQQWGLRSCECIPELAVWDANQNMCRLFAGIGEACAIDSDCMAGELEIQCAINEDGQGVCSCPEGYQAVDGLCLLFGLELGDTCQVSQECTGTANTACLDNLCSCVNGFQEDDGLCAPTLGSTCTTDSDCIIDHSVCLDSTNTCECGTGFVQFLGECLTASTGLGDACNVTEQCTASLGDAGGCVDGVCACAANYHYRDGGCWPRTGLFEACSRSSQCYLSDLTQRVHCRNGLCQCSFEFPYSEELKTCTSSAVNVIGNTVTVLLALIYLSFNI